MKVLYPYDSGHELVRYGRDLDGGYVIADGLDYDLFISCGIGNELSFELMFKYLHPNIDAHAFDGSSLYLDEAESGIHYHRLNIAAENTETTTNLHDYLSTHKDVFLKMDIEGHERAWLAALPDNLMRNIKQFAIEFHGLTACLPFIEHILKTHTLIHIHGNNYGGVIQYNNQTYPNVFECTFLRDVDLISYDRYHGELPRSVDRPNKPNAPDIDLSFLTKP